METTKELKRITTLKNPELIKGTWKLTYTLVNPNGVNAFSGKALSSYTDAITRKARHLTNADGQFLPSFFIDKINTFFNPSEDPEHLIIVDWLLGHPDVGIEKAHTKIDKGYFSKKDANPRLRLVNLDHEDLEELDNEEFVDGLVGQINLETGVHALSLTKFRYILSELNMQYFDAKYIKDKNIEKKHLKKSLKTFVRSSMDNARKVKDIIANLDSAKLSYEIKEMVRLEILDRSNGMFKYRGSGLGVSTASLVKYFKENQEFYIELTDILYEELKEEYNK